MSKEYRQLVEDCYNLLIKEFNNFFVEVHKYYKRKYRGGWKYKFRSDFPMVDVYVEIDRALGTFGSDWPDINYILFKFSFNDNEMVEVKCYS